MPPNPNQIDVSLALLPGNSEAAVQSLVAAMNQVSTNLASLAGGGVGNIADPNTGVVNEGRSIAASTSHAGMNTDAAARMGEVAAALQSFSEEFSKFRNQMAAEAMTTVAPPRGNVPEAPPEVRTVAGASTATGIDVGDFSNALAEATARTIASLQGPPLPPGGDPGGLPGPGGPIDVNVVNAADIGSSVNVGAAVAGSVANASGAAATQEAEVNTGEEHMGRMARFLHDRPIGSFAATTAGNWAAQHFQTSRIIAAQQGRNLFDRNSLANLGVLDGAPIGNVINGPMGIQVQDPRQYVGAMAQGLQTRLGFMAQGAQVPYLGMRGASQFGEEMMRRGRTEEEAQQYISRVLAPARGSFLGTLAPEIQTDIIDQATRVGTQSLESLSRSMNGMGAAARAARMANDEYAQSAMQFAEGVQAQGGTYVGGLNAANTFAMQTGLAPQIGQQLNENGLVQGITMANTGVIPQLQGLLPQSARNEGINESLNTLVGAFEGSFQDTQVDLGNGDTYTITAREQAIGMAAQQMGITPEAAQRLLDAQDIMSDPNMANAHTRLEAYNRDIENARRATGGEGREWEAAVESINEGYGPSGSSINEIIGALEGSGNFSEDQIGRLRESGVEGVELSKRVADIHGERWRDIWGDREGNPEGTQTVEIKFTQRAEQFFQEVARNLPPSKIKEDILRGFLPTTTNRPPPGMTP
jgi:hypothetical protein